MEQRHYQAGQSVYQQGDVSEALYFVREGQVKITSPVEERLITSGQLFGEADVILAAPRSEQAVCPVASVLDIYTVHELEGLVFQAPPEVQQLMMRLIERLNNQPSTPINTSNITPPVQPVNNDPMQALADNFARIAQAMEARCSAVERQLASQPAMAVQNPESDNYERTQHEELTQELIQELTNLGPIMPLLENDDINDILINGARQVYIERRGKLELTDVTFPDDAEVMNVAEKIVRAIGRRMDRRRPLIDARLRDGSRVNIIAPPLAVDGTTISIRKFAKKKITLGVMKEQKNLSEQLADFLRICGRVRLNVVISGGTGSGKTTLLNAVSQFIDEEERVVTIEDAAELQLNQPHVVRLETKPITSGANQREEVTMRDLVKNSLRMRPDRIIVGEVRGPEAFDMMQAMNTGHEGSLTTIHANHPRDALSRLENMVSMANLNIPFSSIRYQIASAINLIIQVSRMRDGHRRVTHVSEIVGMEGDIITMQDLFNFVVEGEDENGHLRGSFRWTGIMPRFLRRVVYYGEGEAMSRALGVKLPRL